MKMLIQAARGGVALAGLATPPRSPGDKTMGGQRKLHRIRPAWATKGFPLFRIGDSMAGRAIHAAVHDTHRLMAAV